MDRTDEVSNHTYGKATLTRFEEIFEEYKKKNYIYQKWSDTVLKNIFLQSLQ